MSKEFDRFDCTATDAQLTAAREILRERGPREAVSLGDLLDTLGDRFPTTPDMHRLIELIYELWNDPHVEQVTGFGGIDFAWVEQPQPRPLR